LLLNNPNPNTISPNNHSNPNNQTINHNNRFLNPSRLAPKNPRNNTLSNNPNSITSHNNSITNPNNNNNSSLLNNKNTLCLNNNNSLPLSNNSNSKNTKNKNIDLLTFVNVIKIEYLLHFHTKFPPNKLSQHIDKKIPKNKGKIIILPLLLLQSDTKTSSRNA
jgi:hypothetical protein